MKAVVCVPASALAAVALFAVLVLSAVAGTEGSTSTASATVTGIQTVQADSMCTATGPLKHLGVPTETTALGPRLKSTAAAKWVDVTFS